MIDDLIAQIASQAGVQPQQARGGTGVLLDLLKKKLDGGSWADLAQAIPGADALAGEGAAVQSAPAKSSGFGGLGGLIGGMAGALGPMGQILAVLSKLGLSQGQAVAIGKAVLAIVGPKLQPSTRAAIDGVVGGFLR